MFLQQQQQQQLQLLLSKGAVAVALAATAAPFGCGVAATPDAAPSTFPSSQAIRRYWTSSLGPPHHGAYHVVGKEGGCAALTSGAYTRGDPQSTGLRCLPPINVAVETSLQQDPHLLLLLHCISPTNRDPLHPRGSEVVASRGAPDVSSLASAGAGFGAAVVTAPPYREGTTTFLQRSRCREPAGGSLHGATDSPWDRTVAVSCTMLFPPDGEVAGRFGASQATAGAPGGGCPQAANTHFS